MSEKIKAIRGNIKRCEDVVKWLKNNGANDAEHQVEGSDEDALYFVDPHGNVKYIRGGFEFLFDVEELPCWRAEKGDTYYHVSDLCNVQSNVDDYASFDTWHHELGNYFQTREEAEEMCNKIVDLFKQRQ